MSKNIPSPIIYKTKYDKSTATQLNKDIKTKLGNDGTAKLLINYPTVYIINENSKGRKAKYTVYVGETNDIQRRTLQHLDADPKSRSDWHQLQQESNNALMYVIGHKHFNKSLTLDIENRMMHYLSSVNAVSQLNNRRDNAQGNYYTDDEMISIFNKIWCKLHLLKPDLFPIQRIIEESALFKASPFHKLTHAQLVAKNEILKVVEQALHTKQSEQLILVQGDAGAGKTVLMSNIFYDLATLNDHKLTVAMMVNHDQQLKVYEQIANKLALGENAEVQKATTFINNHSKENPVDVAFVDEAHLLLTKRNQAYHGHGEDQLLDILKRARVTIAIYDEKQVLSSTQIIEQSDRQEIKQHVNYKVTLKNQMRIDASPKMVEWLRNLLDRQVITVAPHDGSYDLRVFDDPAEMQDAISDKARVDGNNGISRMLATFDWDYSSAKNDDLWEVSEGNWHMPWNLQLKPTKSDKHQIAGVKYSDLSWPEQPHTLNEIGSTYTIQGLDLNYAGVVIGPSVKYRNGEIIFDPAESKDKKVINYRTMRDGSKKKFSTELIKNEFNVLMTRGVHGLYIHAVDPALQRALKEAIQGNDQE